jgi:PEP-CTERM motif
MRFGLVVPAGLLAAAVALFAQPARADLVFTFSFVVTAGDAASGTVTGEIFGLTDNATSAATDVVITSMPDGAPGYAPALPIDIFASSPSVNSNVFTVSDEEITSGEFFASFGPGDNDQLQLEPGTGAQGFPGALSFQDPDNMMNMWDVYDDNTAAVSYSVTPAPEPSSIAVFGIGLFGLPLARRLRSAVRVRIAAHSAFDPTWTRIAESSAPGAAAI